MFAMPLVDQTFAHVTCESCMSAVRLASIKIDPQTAGTDHSDRRAGHSSQMHAMTLQVTDFKHGTVWKLLIASYETLRKFVGELAGTCDLLVRLLSLLISYSY